MCGRETFTMVVSSTSMNAATVTTTAMSHGLALGRQAACESLIGGIPRKAGKHFFLQKEAKTLARLSRTRRRRAP
jgi:hypothetical protein